jgi:DNA-binding NarL/FixJ family response regulator
VAEPQGAAVFIVDPHSIFRLGMATCLESLPQIGTVVGVDGVAEARRHPELPDADLIIVDAAVPDLRPFVQTLRAESDVSVLAAGSGWTADEIATILDTGAMGVLAKESLTPATLEANVHAALHGAAVLPSELMARVFGSPEPDAGGAPRAVASQLSAREQQVLRLIADGLATREVAAKLCYSERTIKNVLHDVVTKFGARSRSQAVAHAVRAGLI